MCNKLFGVNKAFQSVSSFLILNYLFPKLFCDEKKWNFQVFATVGLRSYLFIPTIKEGSEVSKDMQLKSFFFIIQA